MDCNEKKQIEGFVYIDENGNGSREINEKGIKNSIIDLQDLDGKILQSVKTTDVGRYFFQLCPGDYKIKATYTQGENSYLDRYEILVNKDNFTQSQDFKVLKGEEGNTLVYVWIGISFLGFLAIWIVSKLLTKGSSNSL